MLQPLKSKVFVERIEGKNETEGGLILLPTDKSVSGKAIVFACGPLVTDVKIGDIVLFGPEAWGDIYTFEDNEYFIIEESMIAAKECN